jgi:hypothetical protein
LLPLLESEEDRRAQLFDAYIARVLQLRPLNETNYNVAQALSWLRYLSRQLLERNETQFFIEDLQPDWLAIKQRRWMSVLAGVVVSVVVGLLFGVLFGTLFGLLFGVASGVLFGFSVAIEDIEPLPDLFAGFSSRHGRWTVRYKLLGGVLLGGLGGMLYGVLLGHPGRALFGLLVGMLLGLLTDAMFMRPLLRRRRDRPNQDIRRGALHGLYNCVMCGFLYGLFFFLLLLIVWGIIYSLLFSPFLITASWRTILLWGVLVGMTIGVLRYGVGAVFKHYLLRLFMHLSRLAPFHIIEFMEAMRECILVQRTGAHYRFIHRTFQEHIAGLTDERIKELARVATQSPNLTISHSPPAT